jgi:hypothetical protein
MHMSVAVGECDTLGLKDVEDETESDADDVLDREVDREFDSVGDIVKDGVNDVDGLADNELLRE